MGLELTKPSVCLHLHNSSILSSTLAGVDTVHIPGTYTTNGTKIMRSIIVTSHCLLVAISFYLKEQSACRCHQIPTSALLMILSRLLHLPYGTRRPAVSTTSTLQCEFVAHLPQIICVDDVSIGANLLSLFAHHALPQLARAI